MKKMIKVGDIVVPIEAPPKRLSMVDPFHCGYTMTVSEIYMDGGSRMVRLHLTGDGEYFSPAHQHFSNRLNVNIDFVKKSLTNPEN